MGLLLALWMATAAPVQAQALIEQVPVVTSRVEGATTSQVVVEVAEENENVGDVTTLIPGGTPALLSNVSGNGAVIVQDGDNNEATVEQEGSGNEASITQSGNRNESTVEQRPGDGFPGLNNLAVIVQNGSMNQTTVRQFGQNNIAGVRLNGTNNATDILQEGDGNEYRLEFTGTGLGADGTPHTVKQIGDQNMLVQVGQGTTPFNVQQRGDGMRMIIHRNVAPQ